MPDNTCVARVLIADDDEMNRELLRNFMLVLGHDPVEVWDGVDALKKATEEPFDLLMLDMMMPRMGGREVLERLRSNEATKRLPVIVVSAIDNVDTVAACIQAGADDYLVKPFNPVLLRARVGACLETKRLRDLERLHRLEMEMRNQSLQKRVREQIEEISNAQLATIFAMSKLAESRDDETGEHLDRIREYCRILAEELALSLDGEEVVDEAFILNLYAASPLHDIGKVGMPDRILLKPGKLSEDEFSLMKLHPGIGADTLMAVEQLHPGNTFVRTGVEVARSHHEKWDGSGYPQGLAGRDIPLVARIVAIADVYDALTTKRCYKEAFSHERSCNIIRESRGTHFDPHLVDAFFEVEAQWARIRATVEDSQSGLIE